MKTAFFIEKERVDSNALQQIENISAMPFIFKHVAVMPDCHLGRGATVGSVIPTEGAIIPAAVGVDIGCGMIAVKTPFKYDDIKDKDLATIRVGIERRIPLSAGSYNQKIQDTAKDKIAGLEWTAGERVKFYDSLTKNDWRLHLGSLGSGNHFIEITKDEEDSIYAFLHSGSRGIGNRIAMYHIKIAQDLMKKWYIQLVDPDLAYLIEDTEEFNNYIQDLNWAQKFALYNREEMMDRVLTELSYTFWGENGHQKELDTERINCHHNFSQKENHFGKNIWVSRKGAIEASAGKKGLIPGSMGTASYVVSGLGNPGSFNSAPHGAGRNFSRTEARKRFTMEDFDRDMQGIEVKRSTEFIDELPRAYKDIDQVMEDAKSLVQIEHTLSQIINVKGY
jgi:tRNA-splicing ligase RtcB (3'-phosphate/5'-hydroxy nucleic acid ligase)